MRFGIIGPWLWLCWFLKGHAGICFDKDNEGSGCTGDVVLSGVEDKVAKLGGVTCPFAFHLCLSKPEGSIFHFFGDASHSQGLQLPQPELGACGDCGGSA